MLPEPKKDLAMEVHSLSNIPKSWGEPEILIPQHPVKFRDATAGYEYYGRVAEPGVDVIAQRWQGGDKWKDASPVKIDEMQRTYIELSKGQKAEFGIPEDAVAYRKDEPTRVIRVPAGTEVTIFTREKSTEKITGGGDIAIAFDTQGAPYKFDLGKNLKSSGELPPAYKPAEMPSLS